MGYFSLTKVITSRPDFHRVHQSLYFVTIWDIRSRVAGRWRRAEWYCQFYESAVSQDTMVRHSTLNLLLSQYVVWWHYWYSCYTPGRNNLHSFLCTYQIIWIWNESIKSDCMLLLEKLQFCDEIFLWDIVDMEPWHYLTFGLNSTFWHPPICLRTSFVLTVIRLEWWWQCVGQFQCPRMCS